MQAATSKNGLAFEDKGLLSFVSSAYLIHQEHTDTSAILNPNRNDERRIAGRGLMNERRKNGEPKRGITYPSYVKLPMYYSQNAS